jgi:ubiquitin carboxyl-terminal hydrolase 34
MSSFSEKNVKPSKASKPADTRYHLVGVLVHSGSANSGHYYSYIKERKEFASNERWLEFNDTNVTVFDQTKLA